MWVGEWVSLSVAAVANKVASVVVLRSSPLSSPTFPLHQPAPDNPARLVLLYYATSSVRPPVLCGILHGPLLELMRVPDKPDRIILAGCYRNAAQRDTRRARLESRGTSTLPVKIALYHGPYQATSDHGAGGKNRPRHACTSQANGPCGNFGHLRRCTTEQPARRFCCLDADDRYGYFSR